MVHASLDDTALWPNKSGCRPAVARPKGTEEGQCKRGEGVLEKRAVRSPAGTEDSSPGDADSEHGSCAEGGPPRELADILDYLCVLCWEEEEEEKGGGQRGRGGHCSAALHGDSSFSLLGLVAPGCCVSVCTVSEFGTSLPVFDRSSFRVSGCQWFSCLPPCSSAFLAVQVASMGCL